MKKLVIFADGRQAVLDNITIEGAVAEEIDLGTLPEEEREELVRNRRKITIERDEDGKVTSVRLSKKVLKRPRNG